MILSDLTKQMENPELSTYEFWKLAKKYWAEIDLEIYLLERKREIRESELLIMGFKTPTGKNIHGEIINQKHQEFQNRRFQILSRNLPDEEYLEEMRKLVVEFDF